MGSCCCKSLNNKPQITMENKPKHYKLLTSYSDKELSDQVTNYLQNGWELHRETFVNASNTGSADEYCQIVVKLWSY